jgi:K+-transporting ATPase ATPase A chain
LFLAGLFIVYHSESAGNPLLAPFGVSQAQGPLQSGGNMEGKEVRFGIGQSALFATVSTASSDGAVNAMHDSFMPLSALVLMTNMMLDEVVIGGPGSGLFGMLLFVILAVFAAGLMIGRTPEYLGNKIEATEIKMAMLALLCVPAVTLGLTAIAAVNPAGLSALGNQGSHGYSEILYAFTSGTATNGSSFAGLSTNTTFYNLLLAAAMFCGRFLVIVPVLCIAGSLASKKVVPASEGTLPTHGTLFAVFLAATILIMGGLTYLPALSLGPVAEYFQLAAK